MVSQDIKQLRLALVPSFKACGFRKDGSTWRKAFRDAVVIFNIRGSEVRRRLSLTLGTFFRAMPNSGEFRCHVRVRLSDLVPDRARLNDLLDFEKPIALQERLVELESLVSAWGVPWLQAMSACHTARSYMSEHPAISMFEAPDVRILLGISSGAHQAHAADERRSGARA